MSILESSTAPIKNRRAKKPASTANAPSSQVDLREQLVNGGAVGAVEQVALPHEMITSLRGILLDIDPNLFHEQWQRSLAETRLVSSFDQVIRPMFLWHPVLAKAEARASGRGVHVIIWFNAPVEFTTDGDRQRWPGSQNLVEPTAAIDSWTHPEEHPAGPAFQGFSFFQRP